MPTFKQLRTRTTLTQQEIVVETNFRVSSSTIYKVEAGERISPRKAQILLNTYNRLLNTNYALDEMDMEDANDPVLRTAS